MKSFNIVLHFRNRRKDVIKKGGKKLQEFREALSVCPVLFRKLKIPPVAFVFSACLFLSIILGVHNYYNSFFHIVYFEEEEIGLVKEVEDVENILTDLLDAKSEQYELEVFANEELSFSELEFRFRGMVKLDKIQDIITQNLSYFSWGYVVYVDEEPVIHLKDKKVLEELIEILKERYVLTRRDNKIIDVSTAEDITGEKVKVDPKDIISLGEAFVLFYPNSPSERVYMASRGDTFENIATRHNIKVKELEEVNPDLEDHNLEKGQEIKVPISDPLVTIISVEEHKVEEEIPYKTKYVYNDEMYVDKTNTKNDGKPGIKEITYHITRENGKQIKRENVNEKIKQEPVNRVIEKGTKSYSTTSGRQGSGQFIWPVPHSYDGGGRITRSFGGSHSGIDIYAGTLSRTPIIASDSGTVVASYYHSGYGNMIVLSHGRYYTVYAHNSRSMVSTGQSVNKGSIIGYMGNTGQTYGRTGIHLHFEIRDASNSGNWQQARPVNPMNFF